MGHHLVWLLGCCYQRDPAKCPIPRSSREVGICPSPWGPPLSHAAMGCWSSLPSTQRKRCTMHWGTAALWWVRSSRPTTCLHLHNDRALRHISPAACQPGARLSVSSEPKRWLRRGAEEVRCSQAARSPTVGNGTISSGGLKPAQYTWRSRKYITKTILDKASTVTFPWLLRLVYYQCSGKFDTPYLTGEVLCSSPAPAKPMWFSCHTNSFNSLFFSAS